MAQEPSTTELIPLKSIEQGLVVLRDGAARGVVEITAINFELRSSDEQMAILQQFREFLNAIDFPLQIVVHSRIFDISAYLAATQEATNQLNNELLKVQAAEYMRFIRELSELANIMAKRFYVILPISVSMQATETAKGGGFFSGITSIFKKNPAGNSPAHAPAIAQPELYLQQLRQRADLIISGLSGLGLKGKLLEQGELETFFAEYYNPRVPQRPHTT